MAEERYSVKRNDVEDERKDGLERYPDGVVGADYSVDYGDIEFQSSLIVAKKAVRHQAEPHQGHRRQDEMDDHFNLGMSNCVDRRFLDINTNGLLNLKVVASHVWLTGKLK